MTKLLPMTKSITYYFNENSFKFVTHIVVVYFSKLLILMFRNGDVLMLKV